MRNLFIALAVVAVTAVAQSANAQVGATYDPTTGGLVIEGFDNLGGLRIAGPGVPATDPDALGGFADTSIADEVSWLFFAPQSGSLDVGALLPTDLLQSQFDGGEYGAWWVETGGGGQQISVPISGGVVDIIPEPSTYALAGIALIGLGVVRRRRG